MRSIFRRQIAIVTVTVATSAGTVYAQESVVQGAKLSQSAASTTAMMLPQLEQAALQSNPTLAQAQAIIQAAEARRLQAGLLPNPVVGGQVNNFAFRSPSKSADYQGFVVQTIPLGGKLKKMRQ